MADEKKPLSPRVRAIQDADVTPVAEFLRQHLNPNFSVEDWRHGIVPPWSTSAPNHGFLMEDGDTLVGAFPAIYYERQIGGQTVAMCNPHSWCVLEPYRAKGLSLVMPIVRQPGYQFAMLTPNPSVTDIFSFLKFQPMDRELTILPCAPWPFAALGGVRAAASAAELIELLDGDTLRVYRDHAELKWLRHAAIRRGDDTCHIVFKNARVKRLPIARLLYVSDATAFSRNWRHLGNVLLFRFGLVGAMVERRWIADVPWPRVTRHSAQPKLYKGDVIDESTLDDLYTELVALDI